MQPIFARENGRWSTVYHDEKYQDEYCVSFTVKYSGSEKSNTLIIKTKDSYSNALSYSLDGSPAIMCDEYSWINALLQAANQAQYSAHCMKEFELQKDGNKYWYALTEKSKQEMLADFKRGMNLFRHSFTGSLNLALPDTGPGPKFQLESTRNSLQK